MMTLIHNQIQIRFSANADFCFFRCVALHQEPQTHSSIPTKQISGGLLLSRAP
jgi:hypothetical protein